MEYGTAGVAIYPDGSRHIVVAGSSGSTGTFYWDCIFSETRSTKQFCPEFFVHENQT